MQIHEAKTQNASKNVQNLALYFMSSFMLLYWSLITTKFCANSISGAVGIKKISLHRNSGRQ